MGRTDEIRLNLLDAEPGGTIYLVSGSPIALLVSRMFNRNHGRKGTRHTSLERAKLSWDMHVHPARAGVHEGKEGKEGKKGRGRQLRYIRSHIGGSRLNLQG
jgi:hypothetical protein